MDRKNTKAMFHSRDKTYVFLWTYSQFQQEQTEWDAVNRLLQHHGFKPVHFADPIENKNLADLVLLEKKSACDIRTMLRTMLTDSERRQTLIQELIQSNNQLKEEAQLHVSRAARQSQRVSELEGVLDGVKSKLQDLEDSYIGKAAQQHSKVHQLQHDKRDAQKRCQGLEQKLSEEKDVASQLQRKLYFTVTEEEKRVARQNQVFQQIDKRSARPNSPVDQQVLDVIDIYEAQMEQLRDDIKSLKGESGGSQTSDQSQSSMRSTTGVSPNHKALLKSYQEQLKDTKAQRVELRNEIQQLKQDLESRPTVKELKSYKEQLRRMDKLIQQNNMRSAREFKEEESAALSNQEVAKARALAARHKKVLNDIRAVLTTSGAPLRLHRARPSTSHPLSNRASEMVEFDELLSTLEMWAEQLASLKDLHFALSKLMLRLLPWQPAGANSLMESVRVEDLMLLVDTLLEETNSGEDKVLRSPTKNTLQSMVSHFQKLFDITSLSGVYPRMNEVYTRLGEMTNAMRNLRDILALDDRAPPSEVVNQVASLVNSPEATVGHELHVLLGTSDIDSIILKVKEHEEFFPAFYFLVQELLQTLDVDCLDDIMPVLRSLKSRAE
ncbi:centrosomal protein of 70 kDa-like isoform X3 [Salvelinus fontinalis]|uniref:centrosomal protein of 70 kDa-like isoform X3 n=1 Tax=Salvelinus fontinalis TaxID=8038 RepID=UPI0024864394|nr:centrosomal protein of 70 kDa-like isoform X3 [Salvelinus fontinalis]